MKTCKKCKLLQPKENFCKKADMLDGLNNFCKSCIKVKNDIYMKEHKERLSDYY